MNSVKHSLQALLAMLIMLALPASAIETAKPKMTKEDLQKLYSAFLKEEGYKPEIDSDGDVRFKHESKTYFIDVNSAEKDSEFFRVILPGIWKIEDEDERHKVLAASLHACTTTKVAKVVVIKDNTWVIMEMFVAKPADFKAVFKRGLSSIGSALGEFRVKMQELNQKGAK